MERGGGEVEGWMERGGGEVPCAEHPLCAGYPHCSAR